MASLATSTGFPKRFLTSFWKSTPTNDGPRCGAVRITPLWTTPGNPTATRSNSKGSAMPAITPSTAFGVAGWGVSTRPNSDIGFAAASRSTDLMPVPPMSIASVRGPALGFAPVLLDELDFSDVTLLFIIGGKETTTTERVRFPKKEGRTFSCGPHSSLILEGESQRQLHLSRIACAVAQEAVEVEQLRAGKRVHIVCAVEGVEHFSSWSQSVPVAKLERTRQPPIH